MSPKALSVIAAALIGAGAFAGFIPVTSQGANCGSAFVESDNAFVSDLTDSMFGRSSDAQSTCRDLRGILKIPAFILLGGGAVALVSAGVVNNQRPKITTSD
ncbi:hypothetical protein GCM10009525_83330 [Streptosporangium amethystogenes subsp. fukuiense]